jgi:hypothetical protein
MSTQWKVLGVKIAQSDASFVNLIPKLKYTLFKLRLDDQTDL